MEPQTQQPTEDGGSNKASGSSANMICSQSRTRWIPTTDKIRIHKELYHNKGLRSPTVEQIQRICFELKWYGEIESKNIYYWFANQRAREKQKKKSTSDVHVPMQRSGLVGDDSVTNWKHEDQYINFGTSAPASASFAGVMIAFNGQMGNYGGYGSMNTEIETFPLFPMHGEDNFGNMKATSDGGGGHGGGSYISFELSLSCEGKNGKSFRSR